MRSDMREEALALAAAAVEAAIAGGATDAEATLSIADRFSAEARGAQISKLEQSRSRLLSLRTFAGKRRASMSTTDLTYEGVRALAKRIVAAAAFVAEDPHAGLPESVAHIDDDPALGMVSADVAARDAQSKVADAIGLERAIRAIDPRIDNSQGSRASDTQATVALANSRGFRGTYEATSATRSTAPVARDGADKRIGHYGSAARGYGQLESVESVAAAAAKRALELCGARKPQTMNVPVIFERDVAASVLGDLVSAINAANIAVGNSYLTDSIGERIGSELVTIVDDGRLAGGLGTSPFDSEGSPTRRTVVFNRGVLQTFLYDTYYARRLGAQTTGNASGGGIGVNNFYLEAGTQSLDALIASTERGVLVLDTIGFATEYASGTYSRGARGLWIENGEIAYPVDEFTIASNFKVMLAGIDAVANDLRFDGSVVSPSFRVAEMTISGN
ncbi:MAG: TldD/PmbA family protein [Candidatus Velthaea sp.]